MLNIKHLIKVITLMIIATLINSCASIVSKRDWPITINTQPPEVEVTVTNIMNDTVVVGKTPCVIYLSGKSDYASKEQYKVKFSLEGYSDEYKQINFEMNEWFLGNLFPIPGFQSLVGGLVDENSGAKYRPIKDSLFVEMKDTSNNSVNETIIKNVSNSICEYPQTQRPLNTIGISPLFAEGGNLITVNYERLILVNSRILALKIGYGYPFPDNLFSLSPKTIHLYSIPAAFSVNFGERRHFLEIGAGVNFIKGDTEKNIPYGLVGYRFLSMHKGRFNFRVFVQLPYIKDFLNDNKLYTGDVIFWPIGLSYSISF